MSQKDIGHIGIFHFRVAHQPVHIGHSLEPAALEIAQDAVITDGAAMTHVVLSHHQKTLFGEEPGEMIISLGILGNAVDDLNHRFGFTVRFPAAAVDHTTAAGRKIKIRMHRHFLTQILRNLRL